MRFFNIKSKAIRTMLRWQLYVTVVLSVIGGAWAGIHGAISTLLGGSVSIIASAAFGIVISLFPARSAGETLRIVMRAEAAKLSLIVLALWLVLAMYRDVIVGAFIAAFIITVLIFQMAFFVRESEPS